MTNTASLLIALDEIVARETDDLRLEEGLSILDDIRDSFAEEENYYDFLLNYSNFELVAWLNKEIIDALNK